MLTERDSELAGATEGWKSDFLTNSPSDYDRIQLGLGTFGLKHKLLNQEPS